MSDRVLIWHEKDQTSSIDRIGPTFYIDANMVPKSVRIHAVNAPVNGDVEVTIYDDGVSIFKNHLGTIPINGNITYISEAKTVTLPKGQNFETDAESFDISEIAEGSWVHCIVNESGGAKNITVQLELDYA